MFTDSITPKALAVLRLLMAEPALKSFRLVGGTALALQKGHRTSVDLDLFTHGKKLPAELEGKLKSVFGMTSVKAAEDGAILSGFIDGVKIDLVAYPYAWLDDPLVEDGIRLTALSDITAMKVSAVGQRGSRKDFYDIAEILNNYSLRQIMELFRRKFPMAADLHYLQALVYFEDAENEPDPILNARSLTWADAKARITNALRNFPKGAGC